MVDSKGRFIIEDYSKKSGFASFLPGISGVCGIPVWCYYVNRGQCVSCFGTEDKDHSIMEFVTAHQAYLHTGRMGYRTFIRTQTGFYEAFGDTGRAQTMYVDANVLAIEETAADMGIRTQVEYFTLPEEQVGALVRKVTFTNLTDKPCTIEYLDGVPAIVPYGVSQESLKNMAQTAKAWMQVEDVSEGRPYFRVRASMADSAKVTAVEGGNFCVAVDTQGRRLRPIVDSEVIFEYDTSCAVPHLFMEKGIRGVYGEKQMTMNRMPCCFFGEQITMEPHAHYSIWQTTGQAAHKELLTKWLERQPNGNYFEEKLERARELAHEITAPMETQTANAAFDAYCRQDFLDNVLRGGMPIPLGNHEMFYVYGRKHGDMERDYNYFRLSPEYYSQGNGNYRDINQNRRCDAFFFPQVKDRNVRMFYNLIQPDGYNPLGIEKTMYRLPKEQMTDTAQLLGVDASELQSLTESYTPGALAAILLQHREIAQQELTALIGQVIDISESLVASDFLEGYWCDHWTYNLDLLENYLSVYPEKECELLYDMVDMVYTRPMAGVYPRKQRYVETADGIRQYASVYPLTYENPEEKLLCDRSGQLVHATLMEKLLLLNTIKYATLDPYGCGMEMEGGKPGWYDAINGLPALLGSSMPETCELARCLEYTTACLRKYQRAVNLPEELVFFMRKVYETVNRTNVKHGQAYYPIWNAVNDAKETYRAQIYQGISGRRIICDATELLSIMETLEQSVKDGIALAVELGGGLIATYFTYEVTNYCKENDGIRALEFKQHVLPHFLEAPVRYLKLPLSRETKSEVYRRVRTSGLYDRDLSMYKVNESLNRESYELGRCRAFTPGWLENESVWLHMEYKYLLELLKSGLYHEYLEDFHKILIPFLDENRYGRSILENSSFLASSANPDTRLHGKGFVARLSGSTVEFMDMWQRMMFGAQPFKQQDGGLVLELAPLLPRDLLKNDGTLSAVFLGRTKVTYHVKNKDKDYIPEHYTLQGYCLYDDTGEEIRIDGGIISGQTALDVRACRYNRMDVYVR